MLSARACTANKGADLKGSHESSLHMQEVEMPVVHSLLYRGDCGAMQSWSHSIHSMPCPVKGQEVVVGTAVP